MIRDLSLVNGPLDAFNTLIEHGSRWYDEDGRVLSAALSAQGMTMGDLASGIGSDSSIGEWLSGDALVAFQRLRDEANTVAGALRDVLRFGRRGNLDAQMRRFLALRNFGSYLHNTGLGSELRHLESARLVPAQVFSSTNDGLSATDEAALQRLGTFVRLGGAISCGNSTRAFEISEVVSEVSREMRLEPF